MGEFGPRSRSTQPGIERHAEAPKGHPDHRFAAKSLHEAGLQYEAFREACLRTGTLSHSDWDNVERVFGIAEALHQAGVEEVQLAGKCVTPTSLLESIKLWIWKTYQQLPIKRGEKERDPRNLPVDREAYQLLFRHLEGFGLLGSSAILTTNYDIVVEYAAFLNETPCYYPQTWEPQRVSNGSQPFVHDTADEESPVLCKLHGSVNFFEPSGGGVLRVSVELGDGSDIGASPGASFKNEPAIAAMDAIWVAQQQDQRLAPAIIPPSFSKLHGSSWLQETWRAARDALATASDVVFVGYSMPPSDAYMEALLLSAQMFRNSRHHQRVTVVDPNPPSAFSRLYPEVCMISEGFSRAIRGRLPEVLQRVRDG